MKIKDLTREEQPREKLRTLGVKNLSNAELIALILRQGTKDENVVELANKILCRYSIKFLSRASIAQLIKIKGIGTTKASQLVASFELGRRITALPKTKKITIDSARIVAKLLQSELSTLKQEKCIGIYLDSRKRILKQETIFVGSLDSSLIHPREIYKIGIIEGAAGIIIVHNHPSGDPTPSEEDIIVTQQLKEAGKIVGITLLDHIIIGENNYFSLHEEGYF